MSRVNGDSRQGGGLTKALSNLYIVIISSDRSSCTDDGLLYIRAARQLFQIFTQSIDAIDVTSVTLSRLNSINAIDITAYLGDILGEFLG